MLTKLTMLESTPQKTEEKETWNQQLATLILKALFGGGLGAAITLINTDKLPQLLLGTSLGGVGTLLYAFVEPISQKANKGAKQAGDRAAANLGKKTEQMIASAMGMEEKYLQCQALDCQTDRPEGINYSHLTKLQLEEVFVPLKLTRQRANGGYRTEPSRDLLLQPPLDQELDIWALLEQAKTQQPLQQIAILAWGGYGKTTLLKHIAYRRAQDRARKQIPVLLVLRKHGKVLSQESPPILPDLIMNHHIPALPGGQDLSLPKDWAKDILQTGRAIVMLDGFDEVPKAERLAVARWLNEQMRQYHKSIFILTSRPKAYEDQEFADRLDMQSSFWIRELNREQCEKFITQWYYYQEKYAHAGRDTEDVIQEAEKASGDLLAQIEARQELQALAKNPLLLNMIVTFHRYFPGTELPKRRVELYQAICRLQLKDRPSARKLEPLLESGEAQLILQKLALAMMEARQERIVKHDLLQQLNDYLKAEGETVEADQFLEAVVRVSELLVEREIGEYEFAHLSFQEFLAANEIVRRGLESTLYQWFEDDRWKPTILFYAGLVRPEQLMRTMVEQGAFDLAYACGQQTTKRIDPVLQATIRQCRLEKLEALLQAQQWQEADDETYRLMMTTVGKEKQQWFAPEDLRTFPKEELAAIDQLWVKYSKGKFGFSVQTRIWQESGSPTTYSHDWEQFGDRVGWRKDGNWLGYQSLNFDLEQAVSGELPAYSLQNGRGRSRFLFSRIEDLLTAILFSRVSEELG